MAEGRALIQVGVVVIGRNEGERLRRCLASIDPRVAGVVYVDSGSSDGSVALARALSHTVVELDPSRPFSAARARNEGFTALLARHPGVTCAQFVDGDCVIDPEWLERAVRELDADPGLVAVCGRRREMYAERTIWNRIADVEWTHPPAGEARAFGGDVMIRASALAAAGGYNDGVIAAEDDELSVRLRAAGGRILRLEAPMTLHDVHMTRISEWWRRAIRCGHGFAQVAHLHGAPPERYFARERRRALFWGLALPVAIALLAWPTRGGSLLLLGLYPLQVARIALAERERGLALVDALAWGLSCVGSQPANVWGMWRFHRSLRRGGARLIEYKGPGTHAS